MFALKEYVEQVQTILSELPFDQIDKAVQEIRRTRENGNWVFLFGNGGSAANASHWANGLQSVGVKAHVLDNVPIITAIANDLSYDLIFDKQLQGVVTKDDIVIAFSCSGYSKNVVLAARLANLVGATVIGLTAFTGGMLKNDSSISIHVPADSYEIGEDVHSIIGHMITLRLKETQ